MVNIVGRNTEYSFITSPYVAGFLLIVLYVYMMYSRMELPTYVVNLFKNDIVRVIFLSLLLILNFKKSPTISIVVSLVFVGILNKIMIKETEENFIHMGKSLNSMVNARILNTQIKPEK